MKDWQEEIKELTNRIIAESKFGNATNYVRNIVKKNNNNVELYFKLKEAILLLKRNGYLSENRSNNYVKISNGTIADGYYRIDTEKAALNSLSRIAKVGNHKQIRIVESAVFRKYPNIKNKVNKAYLRFREILLSEAKNRKGPTVDLNKIEDATKAMKQIIALNKMKSNNEINQYIYKRERERIIEKFPELKEKNVTQMKREISGEASIPKTVKKSIEKNKDRKIVPKSKQKKEDPKVVKRDDGVISIPQGVEKFGTPASDEKKEERRKKRKVAGFDLNKTNKKKAAPPPYGSIENIKNEEDAKNWLRLMYYNNSTQNPSDPLTWTYTNEKGEEVKRVLSQDRFYNYRKKIIDKFPDKELDKYLASLKTTRGKGKAIKGATSISGEKELPIGIQRFSEIINSIPEKGFEIEWTDPQYYVDHPVPQKFLRDLEKKTIFHTSGPKKGEVKTHGGAAGALINFENPTEEEGMRDYPEQYKRKVKVTRINAMVNAFKELYKEKAHKEKEYSDRFNLFIHLTRRLHDELTELVKAGRVSKDNKIVDAINKFYQQIEKNRYLKFKENGKVDLSNITMDTLDELEKYYLARNKLKNSNKTALTKKQLERIDKLKEKIYEKEREEALGDDSIDDEEIDKTERPYGEFSDEELYGKEGVESDIYRMKKKPSKPVEKPKPDTADIDNEEPLLPGEDEGDDFPPGFQPATQQKNYSRNKRRKVRANLMRNSGKLTFGSKYYETFNDV